MHRLALRRHARLLAGEAPGAARLLPCLTRRGEPVWAEATGKRILWEGQPAALVSLIAVTAQVRMRCTEPMLPAAIDKLPESFILNYSHQHAVQLNRRSHETRPF